MTMYLIVPFLYKCKNECNVKQEKKYKFQYCSHKVEVGLYIQSLKTDGKRYRYYKIR